MLNIKYRGTRLLSYLLDKPAPKKTEPLSDLVDDIRNRFKSLPSFDDKGERTSRAAWERNMNRLKELVLNKDPVEFLRWDVILETMFVAFSSYVGTELSQLKNLPDWEARWRPAIRESQIGRPFVYPFYRESSGNLIHHAYHISQFEEALGDGVDDFKFVLEFGGGYGSVCRLLHNLGFKGKYIIFDLPHFSALQRFYLKALGLPVREIVDYQQTESGIFFVSSLEVLSDLVSNAGRGKGLFVATWSISEAPIHIREEILPIAKRLNNILIAYQDRFEDIDNEEYFRSWKSTVGPAYSWHESLIPHLPGSYYLFGNRNDKTEDPAQ
jgi:hypothetical protein